MNDEDYKRAGNELIYLFLVIIIFIIIILNIYLFKNEAYLQSLCLDLAVIATGYGMYNAW